MLYQLLFKNFKSYKDETVLDMRAENINEFEESIIIDKNGERLLPVSVIYGPNGGGKSGVLEALVALTSLILKPKVILQNSDSEKKYRKFAIYSSIEPYKFDENSKNKPTEFQVYFSTENNIYRYRIAVFKDVIVEEELYKKEFSGKKPAKIFERKRDRVDLGEVLKKANATTNVNENIPYLTFLSITNNIDIIKDVIEWFANITTINYGFEDFENKLRIFTDEVKELVIEIMNAMDINICDYRIEEKGEKEEKEINIYTKHKNNNQIYELDFDEESEGTRKLFSLIPNIIDAMFEGGVVSIDELDAKLHPKLLKYIIMIFKDRDLNDHNAQLIFTSQDLMTMTNQTFRRDEIWFACKNDKKESEIYSLYDIRDENNEHIRANASFSKQYLAGKYGADPYLDRMLNWEEQNV